MTTFWDGSYPPSVLHPVPPVTPITGVTAGTPGAFAPEDATLPADLAALRADPVVGDTGSAKPGAAWASGSWVALGDASEAYWSGTGWQAGRAPNPAATGATAGTPGTFTPAGATTPADLAALGTVTADPATAWTAGQYVVLGDASQASWNGTAWVTGAAPAEDVAEATQAKRRKG